MSSSLVKVDPFRLVADGDDLSAVATAIMRAWTNLESDLSGTAGMAGDDEGAENWARDYDELGAVMNNNAMGCVVAVQSLESLIVGTARAYNNVEGLGAGKGPTSSTIVVAEPTPFTAHNIPSAIGEGWPNMFGEAAEFLEERLADIGLVFPRGDTDKLRKAKGDWEQFSRDIDSANNLLASALSGTQSATLPHSATIETSLSAVQDILTKVSGWSMDEAEQLQGIIDAIEEVRHELQTMITALLLEIAVGAGISIALSFVTFGGAAAVGAGAAAIRIGKFVVDVAVIIRRLASLLRISGTSLARIVSLANKFKNGSFLWRAGFEAGSGAASSIIANFGADIINGNEITPADAWSYILGGAAGGIVSGPLSVGISRALPNNLGVAIGGGAVEGGLSNAATEGIGSVIKGEEFNLGKSLLTGGIGGAAVGGIGHGVETSLSGNHGGSGGGTPPTVNVGSGGNTSVNAPTVDLTPGGGGNGPGGGTPGGGTPGGGTPGGGTNTPTVNVTPPTSTPTIDSPTVDSPTVDSPTVDSPTVDSPTVDSPTVDSPTVDSPTVDSPTVDSPTVDGPTVDAPTTDAPTTDSPTTDGTGDTTPADATTDSPTVDAPTIDGDGPSLADSIGDIDVPDTTNFHLPTDAPPTDAPGTHVGDDGTTGDGTGDTTPGDGDSTVGDDIADIDSPEIENWQTDFDINDPKPDVDVTANDTSTGTPDENAFFGDGGPAAGPGDGTSPDLATSGVHTPPHTDTTVNVENPGPRTPFGGRNELEPNTRYDVEGRGTFYTDAAGNIVHVETSYGGRGTLNPDLMNPTPNTTYVVNDHHVFETDANGHTEAVHVDGLTVGDAYRSDSIQSRIGDLGGDGYDGGHLIANSMGGGAEDINMVSMIASLNRGPGESYFNFEAELRRLITPDVPGGRPPHDVDIHIFPQRTDGNVVPDGFVIEYSIDGIKQRPREFINE